MNNDLLTYEELTKEVMHRLAVANNLPDDCFPRSPHTPDEIMGDLLQNGEDYEIGGVQVLRFDISSDVAQSTGIYTIREYYDSKYDEDADDIIVHVIGYDIN